MKFDEAEQKIEKIEKKEYSKSFGFNSEKNIRSVYRYDNLSVILLAPGSKGDFKYLSTLINDGIKQTSWCIRIYYTNGLWGVQIGPNSLFSKDDITINVSEIFDEFGSYKNLTSTSTIHTGILSSKNKDVIEKAIKFLIDGFRNKELKCTEKLLLSTKYTLKNNSHDFKLEYNLSDIKINNENTIKKYAEMYRKLLEKNVDDIQLKQVDMKGLNMKDKELILTLAHKYLTEHERIQIAMRYMNE